ncbi:phenylalanine--tRNA ligase subunit beta [bacterium]|nr:phenylalanine--tRNA ligase subunit beta [bacterium]MBU1957997.1 phenylalanine--tRNA ligase subunit beta [bacterium]
MIVTKSWLNNFIDLSEVSNETLYETLNSIGLEVDSITAHTIPEKIVIGKVLSCEKHPDADKLNVCQIDIGSGIRQIVCGAANVVDAQYVAVATIGAKLGEDFEIKHAKLRGVESEGMVCSASELGLPNIGEGIMILDESIGELIIGKNINEYEKIADTVIEIELTANRGDCLSVYGVARDLSAALNTPLKNLDYESQNTEKVGLARVAKLTVDGQIDASLQYAMANMKALHTSLLFSLRLAFINEFKEDDLANILKYITHTTGTILRAYDVSDIDLENDEKLIINAENQNGIINISINNKPSSQVGINQIEATKANEKSSKVLFETSYMRPTLLVDLVADNKLETDELYYNASRGSEPNLYMGINYLTYLFETYNECKLFDGTISVGEELEAKTITISTKEICQLIGNDIHKTEIMNILTALGCTVQSSVEEKFGVTIPSFRHDIENIQDITEEIVRILGINNIEAKPLTFTEVPRTNTTMQKYYAKKELRARATAASFDESVSYAFADKTLLEKYGFPLVKEELDIINPITADFNTLRTTILINLLQAVQRNVSYSRKSVALFEIGTIFNENREEKEMFSLVYSGQAQTEYVENSGKPNPINFDTFVRKLSSIIGNFELRASVQENALIHPYQSADIIVDGAICGFLTKVHPTVTDAFDIIETFVAEIDFNALLPKHINAHPISKFQGVYKDLSLVIDKNLSYTHLDTTIKGLNLPLLTKYYPVDIYEDESLAGQKSLTLRLFIQSLERTLNDKDIDSTVNAIIDTLQSEYGASLR